jgi:hypothetical protein
MKILVFELDKTLNDMVPQLIPRDPVNIDGVKPGFNTIRSTIQTNETIQIDIDPTSNAPIAVFDGNKSIFEIFHLFVFLIECDNHIPTNQKPGQLISISSPHLFFLFLEESISTYVSPPSPNFPRLTPYSTIRRSSSRTNV